MLKTLIKKISLSQDVPEDLLTDEFRQKYLETKDFVRASIYWMVRSEAVDDLVQNSFLKAWKNYRKFKKGSSFKTWIYRIAMNVAYDYLKQQQKELKAKNNNEEIEESSFDQDKALEDIISKGLLRMKAKHREVFILFYKFGYSKNEIATLLNISEGTVKSRVYYAKENFVVFLKKNGVEGER